MYRHIPVPLDGSKRAEVVIPHVIEFARVRNARPLLLRVIEPLQMEAIVAGPVVAASVPARAVLGGCPGTDESGSRGISQAAESETRIQRY